MTLLVTLSKSGHVASIESFLTPGLASQQARCYADSGVTCRVVPDELREDVEYLAGQIQTQKEIGFVEEYSRPREMIYPAFGGMLEGDGRVARTVENDASPSLTLSKNTDTGCEFCDHGSNCECLHPELSHPLLSSESSKNKPKKVMEDLILPRHG